MKYVAKLLLAVVVVLVAIAAYWYWLKRATVKFTVSGAAPAAGGALSLAVATTSKADLDGLAGKKIVVHTKSLGKVTSTVAGYKTGAIMTAAGAYTGKAVYAADPGDYARVYLK
jgi:hypothetical protein